MDNIAKKKYNAKYQRARQRALRELAERHDREFRELLLEHYEAAGIRPLQTRAHRYG